MYVNSRCLALRTIKYNDAKSIVSVWSDTLGYITVAVSAGAGREARRRRALMMPMSVFEAVIDAKPGHEMVTLRDVRPGGVISDMDGARTIVALFMADFLERVLRNCQADTALTAFVFETATLLRSVSPAALANLHLFIIYRLTGLLGFEPDMSTWNDGACFDMREGRWRLVPPADGRRYIDADRSRGLMLLDRLNMRNIGRVRLSRDQRNELLDGLLEYYTIHHTPLTGLTSLEIVRTLF